MRGLGVAEVNMKETKHIRREVMQNEDKRMDIFLERKAKRVQSVRPYLGALMRLRSFASVKKDQ